MGVERSRPLFFETGEDIGFEAVEAVFVAQAEHACDDGEVEDGNFGEVDASGRRRRVLVLYEQKKGTLEAISEKIVLKNTHKPSYIVPNNASISSLSSGSLSSVFPLSSNN